MNHMRGGWRIFAAYFLLAVLARGQPATWESIHARAADAVRHGKWQEAEPLLQSALQEAEAGAKLTTSLKDLADFYQMQGRHADSERYLRRIAEIRESVSGPKSDEVAG